jgi:alkylation response protein AidB-like acyl-CoA dehydrogenase
MDFTLTEDEQLLKETARRLLTAECPPSLVRAHIDDREVAGGLWDHLAGWTELGAGPMTDLCLFLEETGAALAPGPFFATTVLWYPLATAIGADPSAVGTVAMAGANGSWQVNQDPVKTFVLDADRTEQVAFVLAGPSVAVADTSSVSLRPVETVDSSRRMFEARVPDGIVGEPVDPSVIEEMLERAWVGLSAELMGTARWLLDTTIAYARARVQFDRPIGSFQAIQHKLADVALGVERAWAATYYAAMAMDAADAVSGGGVGGGAGGGAGGGPGALPDSERRRAAHVAKASAAAAAHRAAKDAVQVHGGIGFTWDYDLHLWMRRAFASESLFGSREWHHDRLADLLLV